MKLEEAQREAQRLAREAMRNLYFIMTDADVAPAVRIVAANSLLDRAYGKAVQPVAAAEVAGDGQIVYRIVGPDGAPKKIISFSEYRKSQAADGKGV